MLSLLFLSQSSHLRMSTLDKRDFHICLYVYPPIQAFNYLNRFFLVHYSHIYTFCQISMCCKGDSYTIQLPDLAKQRVFYLKTLLDRRMLLSACNLSSLNKFNKSYCRHMFYEYHFTPSAFHLPQAFLILLLFHRSIFQRNSNLPCYFPSFRL